MRKNYFITGTDTDCGKTLITEALLLKAREQGLRAVGLKPLAAGATATEEGLRNGDALRLQRASTIDLRYEQINPVVFEPPIAPHIAATRAGKRITISTLTGYVRGAMSYPADLRLIEGAGGWLVPINEMESLSSLPEELGVDVILVVGMKLGCLNHALLTARAIRQSGVHLAGWAATQVDPQMYCVEENLASLKNMLGSPFLGFVPYIESVTAERAASFLQLPV